MASFRLRYWGSAVIGGVSVYCAMCFGGIAVFSMVAKVAGLKSDSMPPIPLYVSAPLCLVFSGMTCWLLRYRRRLRRARAGQCLHCGYDLRASAERCPECGRTNAVMKT